MMAERCKKINRQQCAALLKFLERNPCLLKNKFSRSFTMRMRNELWEELTLMLNSQGGSQKPAKKWQKTLTDWKCAVKAKAARLKQEKMNIVGGGPTTELSDLEVQLLGLMTREELIETLDIPENDASVTSSFSQDTTLSNHDLLIKQEEVEVPPEPPKDLETSTNECILGLLSTTQEDTPHNHQFEKRNRSNEKEEELHDHVPLVKSEVTEVPPELPNVLETLVSESSSCLPDFSPADVPPSSLSENRKVDKHTQAGEVTHDHMVTQTSPTNGLKGISSVIRESCESLMKMMTQHHLELVQLKEKELELQRRKVVAYEKWVEAQIRK